MTNTINTNASPQVNKKLYSSNILLGVLFVLVFTISFLSYNYFRNNHSRGNYDESQSSIESLSEVFLIPDETPTIATVLNVELLKNDNPGFYENAQNGDKLFIFVERKRAIIFRPNEGRVINVADINFDDIKQVENDIPGLSDNE